MRIRYKVALVGGIPITIAAAIAVAAWLLLTEADRARNGAVLAGAAYRNLLTALTARDEYVSDLSPERARHVARFTQAGDEAQTRLDALLGRTDEPDRRAATNATRDALARYQGRMRDLVGVTERNDALIAEMGARAASLIGLTDRARERQRASNADIITSLKEGDRKLLVTRDIVDRAHELRAAFLDAEIHRARGAAGRTGDGANGSPSLGFTLTRLRNATADLAHFLRDDERVAIADELEGVARNYERGEPPSVAAEGGAARDAPTDRFQAWIDRLIKVNSTEQRALHDEVAQLLTYSVEAAETEQATQNIAIATLKLGRRTADAFASRDVAAATSLLEEGQKLRTTMRTLPISPLIQAEMIEAIDRWSEGLATTAEGLRGQNAILADMNAMVPVMVDGAAALNDTFTQDADSIGQFVRSILVAGAAVGLLLGATTAFVVARSITGPLRRLQDGMMRLAADPTAGMIEGSRRRDELGAMARAANLFVTEIGQRERALRRAKERADATLRELRETQATLIQSEKLASLGQLVAGVAHEINSPIGVALTTSTALDADVKRLGSSLESGRLLRSELTHIVGRLNEGARLLFVNLTRAVDLVHSFKQVAADRASGERRPFEVNGWMRDLLTSLGPVLRKKGHEVATECPDDIVLDSYPGALAQVLTNLIMNAVVHAYPDGQAGCMRLTVSRSSRGELRIVFADDGRGIAPEHLGKVFDPFFTTGRDQGSTGLGLHIVYNLVTVTLQGRIAIESWPGQGTRFLVDLPLVLDTAAKQPIHAPA
jgi:signal transduction histidine kinase